ncbi:hypothetical protein BH09MYX1_BH09MYX1_44870 [soil metagenome]
MYRRTRFALFLLPLVLGAIACKSHEAATTTTDGGDEAEAGDDLANVEGPGAGEIDAAALAAAKKVIAIASPAPIFSATEYPPKDPEKAEADRKSVIRLGYIRNGESVAVKPDVIKKSNCAEGWWELIEGGFICGKFVTDDPNHAELKDGKALHPPLDDGPLPYQYGLNLTNGAPLYRRYPTKAERTTAERGLLVGKSRPGDLAVKQQAAAAADGSVPWYLQDHKGARPMVSFNDIKGETGLITLRMIKGFYLALDREAHGGAGKLWKTTSGDFAPAEHIIVHKSVTEFEGIDFQKPGETRKLPLGWVLNPKAWKYDLAEDGAKMKRHDNVARFTIVELTGKKMVLENRTYYETKDGWWLKDVEGTVTKPDPAPSDLKPGEKWIDVNVTTESLVAYEGDKAVYATLVSSGRTDDKDPTKDHRTKTGTFVIREKHVAATMDDDSASDGPYSIQDVPWIMYFHGSIALHGAFWHSSFGRERSHGCVNLTPFDAKNIFKWVGPRLPTGWHGVRATDANPGSRVIVHT